jgi:hypothetical protein
MPGLPTTAQKVAQTPYGKSGRAPRSYVSLPTNSYRVRARGSCSWRIVANCRGYAHFSRRARATITNPVFLYSELFPNRIDVLLDLVVHHDGVGPFALETFTAPLASRVDAEL